MAKNVHIEEVPKVRLPSVVTEEDRGLQFCSVPIRAFATLDSVDLEKNSRLGLAFKFDSMTISLIRQRDGAEIAAPGIVVNFPNQSDAVGFVIDWRQLTRTGPGGTELDQGCYQVKVSWTLGIAAGFFFETSVELLQFNNNNTEGFVNMFVVLNDVVTTEGISINYKDSGFATTIAFRGQFGYMQPNFLTTNNIYSPDNDRRKVRILPVRTYELRTNFLLSCATQQIDERFLLAANQIFITDFNANNHVQKRYTNFPVIISEEESPVFEYDTSIYAKMTVIFKDKQQLAESKYDGNIKGSDNIILELPVLIGAPTVGIVGTTAKNLKTGITISQATGDDGDTERGRDTDILALEEVNPFGNLRSYTGTTGGSHNGTIYVDVNQIATTRALAFPDDIKIAWNTKHKDGTVLGYYFGDANVGTSRTQPNSVIWGNTLVHATFSDWNLMNANEANNIIHRGISQALNYPPISINVGTAYWTSSPAFNFPTTQSHLLGSVAQNISPVANTNIFRGIAVREYTLTELGL